VEPAPLLAIDDEHVHLDGDPIPSGELGPALRKLVGIYRTLRPGQPFNGQILVACAPQTSTRLLAEYLKVLLAAEFVHPVFLFIQPDAAAKTDRSADRVTGARATMEKDTTATPLRVREHASYESLARAVVAERTRGKAVFLDLGTADATRTSRPAARPRVPRPPRPPRPPTQVVLPE
jgi:hypothetical protein